MAGHVFTLYPTREVRLEMSGAFGVKNVVHAFAEYVLDRLGSDCQHLVVVRLQQPFLEGWPRELKSDLSHEILESIH